MNISIDKVTTHPKENMKSQINQNKDLNKHSFLNTKASSRSVKEPKKNIRSFKRKATPRHITSSDVSENLKMFKHYFDSKVNKTLKKLNQTMGHNEDIQTIAKTTKKPFANNSNLNKTTTDFVHKPVDSMELVLPKKQRKLTNRKESARTNNKNTHITKLKRTSKSTKQSRNMSPKVDVSLINKKSLESKSNKNEGNHLKQTLRRVNCITKMKKNTEGRNSCKAEKTNANFQKKILESIKETKISSHKLRDSYSFKKKNEDKISNTTEGEEKTNKNKINDYENKDGIKVVVYAQGKIKQVVELLYESDLTKWNENIEKKIENFNKHLNIIDIIHKKYSIILSKTIKNEKEDAQQIVENKKKLEKQEEGINSKGIHAKPIKKVNKQNEISFNIINEEIIKKTKFNYQLVPCSSLFINIFSKRKEKLIDNINDPQKRSKDKINLGINHFTINIIHEKTSIPKDNIETNIHTNKQNKKATLTVESKVNNISFDYEQQKKSFVPHVQNSFKLQGIPLSFKGKIFPSEKPLIVSYYNHRQNYPTFLKSKNDEIEFISELSNIRGEQNLKQNIQVDIIEQTVKNEGIDITQKTQPHKEMKLFYEQSPPNNSTLSFSLKERIALINNHFLMGGNEGNENNQQIIDTEQLPNNNNQFTFINPLNDIMKPVSHLKKQKPTYKIFDENYSKSVEIDFQVQNSLQKTIAKAKNLRNVLKKKK